MKLLQVSIREFAVPVPRLGSIEAHSGYGRAQEGQEIHLEIQAARQLENPDYQSEVRVVREFQRDGYTFQVGGRMDGLLPGEPPVIEEIKTAFSAWDLLRKLSEQPREHPYCLQLRTYGYFYWLEHKVAPELSFHLVSTRNREAEDFGIQLDIPSYERWLERRLDELVEEAKKAEKRAERRRKAASEFAFPFPVPRPHQEELIQTVEEGVREGRRMLIQAPTGLGKTVGVLYPSLREALGRGHKVVYVTPKNSQHSVAEDAVERFQEQGSKVKSLTITAKSKICFKAEPLCNPDYCEYARDYYTKLHEHKILDTLARKRKLKAKTFRELGEEYEVCPFELQLDSAQDVEVVICDYNYVFAPRAAFGRMALSSIGQEGKPNLVIDEAHNLPSRAMDYYSPALSTLALEKMREAILELPERFREEAVTLLNECQRCVLACAPKEVGAAEAGSEVAVEPRSGGTPRPGGRWRPQKSVRIEPPVSPFLEQEAKLRAFLSRYLDSDVEIRPRDVVLRLSFYWSEFTAALDYVAVGSHDEFFTTYQSFGHGGTEGTVKITCCDASKMLVACYDEYQNVVGFSATLKPFEYYARLSGLHTEELKTGEFQSPFPRENRKLLIIPQVSTKYSDRERNYPRIADAIRRIAALRKGNYFVFFPSFEFLGRVLDGFDPPPGFSILRQEREMKLPDVEAVLDRLRAQDEPTLIFAVQGGVFAEGVDYPGDMIIGAFVIGPPLPNFDLEREEMRAYYEKNYGAGFDYAYAYPAMAKAVQAAGRVIRSETDRGLIVLMDERFLRPSYFGSMPGDWFNESPSELISASILKDVAEFWESGKDTS